MSEKLLSGRKYQVLILMVLGMAYFFSNFHRLALGVLGTAIASDMELSSLQIGTLGSAIFYSYAIMQLPCGVIADRISTRKLIAVSCIITGLSTILFSVANTFPVMVAARVLTGLSTALIYVPAIAFIRKKYGDATLGMMTGIMVAMGQIGSVCASAPLNWLNNWIGWKMTFVVIGIIAAFLGFAAWYLIPAEKKEISSSKIDRKHGILIGASVVICMWFFVTGGARLSFQSLWGNKFFTEAKLISSSESGILLMFISIGCIIGSVILGKVSDRIGCIKTVIVATIINVVTWVAFALIESGNILLLTFNALLLGIVGAGGFTVGFSCVKEFAPAGATGKLTGIFNFFAFLGSALFTQVSGKYMECVAGEIPVSQGNILVMTFAILCTLVVIPVIIYVKKSDRRK